MNQTRPPVNCAILTTARTQAIGTPQLIEAVTEAACAKPLENQLAMFEVGVVSVVRAAFCVGCRGVGWSARSGVIVVQMNCQPVVGIPWHSRGHFSENRVLISGSMA